MVGGTMAEQWSVAGQLGTAITGQKTRFVPLSNYNIYRRDTLDKVTSKIALDTENVL